MKIKRVLICGLAATVLALSGCTDKSGSSAQTSGTSRTSVTTVTTVTSEVTTTEETFHGEYEADEDGSVGTEETTPMTDDIMPSDVTDDGVVRNGRGTDEAIVTDEAAFASSYIDKKSGNNLSNKKIGWGLGKEKDNKNRPVDAVKAEEKYKSLKARFLTEDGNICLTFDEGYENGYTSKILDTLKEKNVKAVFFVTYDYCRTSPELVKRMVDEGHTVGNHTYSHPSMPDITQKQVWAEVTKLHDYVKENFGYEMTLFRFPMGEFSERCLDDLKNLGYTSVFWSFAYKDWSPDDQPAPADALEKLKSSTHSGIYLLHAVSSTNAQILGEIIDYWRDNGYSVGSGI